MQVNRAPAKYGFQKTWHMGEDLIATDQSPSKRHGMSVDQQVHR